ncbi:MAG: bifunctional folylpolyglutamate synthase/dihydrofolate synthase [Chloroflexota bacterium]
MTGRPPPTLTYADAVAALADRGRFGIRLGLGRVRALLHELGDPQLRVRGALVAGTNGKGSVIALAGSALRAAGIHVAETPKPHLVSYRERLVVDGRPIGEATFARLVATVLPIADRVARRHGDPTEFELLTAVMFAWFGEIGVELALVEVGLGGRLDATNAWDGGVAVLTNVGLDHMDRLGSTVEAIAREKVAIVKRGDVAVTGADGSALAILRRRCRRLGVPLTVAAAPPVLDVDRNGIVAPIGALGPTRIGLRGRHQAANAAVADALLDALDAAGLASVAPDARRRGYESATWPGRLELLRVRGRDVLLDGAHNPAGAAALAVALDDLRPYLDGGDRTPPAPVTLVWASMADKDVDGAIRAVTSAAATRGARVIATSLPLERALPAETLAEQWTSIAPDVHVVAEPDPDRALEMAVDGTGPVVVAGSLYLVGHVRGWLVPETDVPAAVARDATTASRG